MMVPRALGGWMPTGSSPIPGSASYNVARGNVHISMSAKANELFTTYTAKAPLESGRLLDAGYCGTGAQGYCAERGGGCKRF